MSLKQILVSNKYFIVPFLISILGGAFFMSIYTTSEGHLLVNQYHSLFFDTFFRYITYLGDGVMFAVIIILGLFIRFRISLYSIIVGVLILFVISYISKELLFHDWPRPAKVFGEGNLHYIDGVVNHMISTFPSGHSTTAFGIYTLVALFCKRNSAKLVFAIIAILTAFSRVYLSQHFIRDIVVGAVIGVIIAIAVYYYFNKIFKEGSSLDKSLLKLK